LTYHRFSFFVLFFLFGARLFSFCFLFYVSNTYLTHVAKIDIFEIESRFRWSLTSYM
jgi:hypothetical protein